MPENIDARHRVVNLLHESGVETLDPGHSRSTLSLATDQDEARLSFAEERDSRDRMRASVVGMDNARIPLASDGSQFTRGANIPLAPKGEPISRKSRMFGALDERRTGRSDDQRSIAEVAQAGGEQKYLTLAAAPTAPGIDVKNPGKLHYGWSFRANALNSPRSHGSAESVISSGCHCTAITHQSLSVDSIPSMTPSGERAVIRIPSATRLTD